MRPLELVLLLILVVRWVGPRLRPGWGLAAQGARERSVVGGWATPLLIAAGAIAQIVLEGPRWNLAGLYAAAVWLLVADVTAQLRARRGVGWVPAARLARWRRGVSASTGVIVLTVLAAPAVLLPVPRLPAPTGPYAVGTDAIEYRAPAVEGGAPVRVRARLWYPAASTPAAAGDRRWLEHLDVMLPALARRAGLPQGALAHLRYTRTHATWGAPLAGPATLDVVTFDHGRGGFAAQNAFLAEELASHGWLVVAPDHPGGAVLTVFRDGTQVPFDPAAFGEGLAGAAYDGAIRTLGMAWSRETAAALDAIAAGAGPAGLSERIREASWVATGHSTGGGAAFGLCAARPGCVGAIGFDPWMLPTPPKLLLPAPEGGLSVPLLGLFSDPELGFFAPENLEAFDRLASATREAGFAVERSIYAGAGHMDFADVALLSPLAARLGLYVGPAPAREVLPRIRADVLAFLAGLR